MTEFFDPQRMFTHAAELDDIAQRVLALQDPITGALATARSHTGSVPSDLDGAMSTFGRLWARQSELLAVYLAELSRTELQVRKAVLDADARGADAFPESSSGTPPVVQPPLLSP